MQAPLKNYKGKLIKSKKSTRELHDPPTTPQKKKFEVQYSNKDHKTILNILHRMLFVLKSSTISLSPYGLHDAMWSSLLHNPVSVTSKEPSASSQHINHLVWQHPNYSKSCKCKRSQLSSYRTVQ